MHIIMCDQVIRARRRRRDHSPEFKRELVARSLLPNASVSSIALEAGINANLLFTWRRAHLDAMGVPRSPAILVPVQIEAPSEDDVPASSPPTPTPTPTVPRTAGTIEIDLAGARIRLRGTVDEASVRCVLQTLHALA